MLSGLERHISIVSLLLIAGAGLILLEGPVGASYLRQVLAPNQVEKQTPKTAETHAAPEAEKPVAHTVKLDARLSTWAITVDNASPLHSTVLGEIPLNSAFPTKSDPATGSK